MPTESIKKIIQDWGVENENITAIPTGIEEEIYQNPDGKKIREKYKIKSGEVLLFLASRLTEEKNVKFLFESIIKVLKINNNAKFLVAGEGYTEPELKKMVAENNIEDKVIFAGLVGKKEIKNYYAAGDIFVYASLSETQGMIISEAMYSGLPIVAVRATGAQDLVEEDINGFLVKNNKNEFAEAVNRLIANKNLREKFAENSKKIAKEKYTSQVCAGKMLKVYAKIIRAKK